MSGLADFLMSDDDGQLLRSIMRRLDVLEFARSNDVPAGAIVGFPGQIRGSKWSSDRLQSVGTKYSTWWRLNDLNEDLVFEEIHEVAADRMLSAGSGADVQMGQAGGLRSEGGYSANFDAGKYLQSSKFQTSGARDWTIEAIFRPETIPQNNAIVFSNGLGSSGQGIRITDGAGGSGNRVICVLNGVNYYNITLAVAAMDWCHVIYVSDSSDNTLKMYGARFRPTTQQFTYVPGSMAVAGAITPVSGSIIGQGFDGLVDEVQFYNGKLTAAEAEDRIRCAMMPGPPAGWVAADGGIVARQKYPNLFARVGVAYSAGDGSTTFGLPNVPSSIVKV